jgi:transposase
MIAAGSLLRAPQGLLERRNVNVAVVAMANKTARIIWALLARDRQYDPAHVSGR